MQMELTRENSQCLYLRRRYQEIHSYLAAVDVFHDKAEEIRRLEAVVQARQERMCTFRQHVVLCQRMCQLVLLQHHGLLEDLNGVNLNGKNRTQSRTDDDDIARPVTNFLRLLPRRLDNLRSRWTSCAQA